MAEIIKNNSKKNKPKLEREMLSVIGKKLGEFEGVEQVAIYVEFKDGTGMKFRVGEEDE